MKSVWPTNRDPEWPLPDRPDHPFYREVLRAAYHDGDYALFRETALNDFWFFCRHVLSLGRVRCDDPFNAHHGRSWMDHKWLFDRCREIQAEPNGFADLWPRYHRKTSIITQALTLWDLADNPNLRFAIITYKIDTVGSQFLYQIKQEAQENELLKRLFPKTFWPNPEKQSPQWSGDALCFRRALNPREPTITLTSLRAPITGFHVDVRVWDDIVTEANVSSSETIDDTTTRVRNMSGTAADYTVDRWTGTHWAVGDTWEALFKAGVCKKRHRDLYEEDGQTPVLMSREWCESMYRQMTLIGGTAHWVCVMRNMPELASDRHFDPAWIEWYEEPPEQIRSKLNVYILIDPAKAKNKDSDFTVIAVIGLGKGSPIGHYYLLDMVRDRIGLVEMGNHVFRLVEKWKPTYVFIEEVAMARDSEYLRARMNDELFKFRVIAYDDKVPKVEGIKKLQPIFENRRFHLPRRLDSRMEGRPVDLIERFLREEYRVWMPNRPSKYDDTLDCISRIKSPKVEPVLRFPVEQPLPYELKPSDRYERQAPRGWRGSSAAKAQAWAM